MRPPRAALRSLYALLGATVAAVWALLGRHTDEALSVHGIGSQVSQVGMAPLLEPWASLGRCWVGKATPTTTEARHIATQCWAWPLRYLA